MLTFVRHHRRIKRTGGGYRTLDQYRCHCGAAVIADRWNVRSGNTKSCGCIRHDIRGNLQHGMYRTAEYRAWKNMIHRCENRGQKDWKHYGGRGIRVCPEWRRSFIAFFLDMGERPDGRSLDRVDADGNYEPSNCRWADTRTQRTNQRVRRSCLRGHPYPENRSRAGCRTCRRDRRRLSAHRS